MNEFKGTPGPWRLRNRLTSIDVDIPAEGPYDTIEDIQNIHDAQLIAAAPELLEALLDLEARACVYVNTSKAKAAIAKALGESK